MGSRVNIRWAGGPPGTVCRVSIIHQYCTSDTQLGHPSAAYLRHVAPAERDGHDAREARRTLAQACHANMSCDVAVVWARRGKLCGAVLWCAGYNM